MEERERERDVGWCGVDDSAQLSAEELTVDCQKLWLHMRSFVIFLLCLSSTKLKNEFWRIFRQKKSFDAQLIKEAWSQSTESKSLSASLSIARYHKKIFTSEIFCAFFTCWYQLPRVKRTYQAKVYILNRHWSYKTIPGMMQTLAN